ncbi:RagB/SusD family nutrient uptake outer membrane protein [Chitinophaga japonensis]|uniref:Putative outer membrane starch-binding protein n=1 Tax=Chitinophaga japonensis TaxID=104662 RepID=A0A562STY2_CHIJA|nr:RagB/SusD family nutrient uptake outer membrane protein [Chitinophaga japonensis]TWI84444.1 putative outer membrane starch-binding protein [Chitinophaga japonensis]
MKQLLYIVLAGGISLAMGACQKTFLDLEPQDELTDVVYFKRPADFKAYTTGFYSQLMGWKSPFGGNSIYQYMDAGSDLSTNTGFSGDYARGNITVPGDDNRWSNPYNWIRSANILLENAAAYTGSQEEIKQYMAEASFFRANAYFTLLRFFGGVPLVTTVPGVKSPELTAPRNSRYEVIDLILSDLDKAIAGLPAEQEIAAADKGRISKWAAGAYKARVLLYEATWRKYVGTSTDFAGSGGPSSEQVSAFLTETISLCKEVMDNGGYELWDQNNTLDGQSSYFLFNLEDGGSNPAGLTKATNKEFILYGVYDFTYRQGGQNLTHTTAQMIPSRKMMDLYLCTDGLPPAKSPLFQGYHNVGDEFRNRDLRMTAYHGEAPASATLDNGLAGYGNRKFAVYNYGSYRNANQESSNYSIIRLADVYLMYAEALYEKNGSISDAQLDESVNKIRARAGVAPLTNALVAANGLSMLEEIRNERARELYQEGLRFDDLKRWGIAEAALNASTCGMVVGDAAYTTAFRDASGDATASYKPAAYVWGEETVATAAGNLSCVVIDSKSNRNFKRTHYLLPIPATQLVLNPNLQQNPGYN